MKNWKCKSKIQSISANSEYIIVPSANYSEFLIRVKNKSSRGPPKFNYSSIVKITCLCWGIWCFRQVFGVAMVGDIVDHWFKFAFSIETDVNYISYEIKLWVLHKIQKKITWQWTNVFNPAIVLIALCSEKNV